MYHYAIPNLVQLPGLAMGSWSTWRSSFRSSWTPIRMIWPATCAKMLLWYAKNESNSCKGLMQRWPGIWDMTWIWHDINGCDAILCQKGEKMLHHTAIKCRCTEFTKHNRASTRVLSASNLKDLSWTRLHSIPCTSMYQSISHDLTPFFHPLWWFFALQGVDMDDSGFWAFQGDALPLRSAALNSNDDCGQRLAMGDASNIFKLGVESALCRWSNYLIN